VDRVHTPSRLRSPPGCRTPAEWLSEVFEAALAAVPGELRPKLEPAEMFHEILEHRWYMSEAAGKDVGLQAAVRSYADQVLRPAPDERTVLSQAVEPDHGERGSG
jgi:hypothetical protein